MVKITVKKLPKSEVEIEGELEADIFESYFANALKKIGENIELDGFRKGKVPENILASKVPEIQILEKMAEIAISEYYPKIISGEIGGEKVDAISRPEISIVKLARKNPLGFKIKTAVLPEIKLPDYKGAAKKITSSVKDAEKDLTVTDKELEDTIMDIRKSRAPKKPMKEGADLAKEAKAGVAGSPEKEVKGKVEETKSSKTGSPDASEEAQEEVKEDLPEVNDEFVKGLGPFENVADFKAKLKENIKLEKGNRNKEKIRLKIIEKVIEDSKVEVPEILVGIELDKILYKMESDVTAMGLKFEDYLKHMNKTRNDLKKDFRGDAEKKAKLGLILNEIAKAEKIKADADQVEKEVASILEHYKDADKERARMHAENVLTNEKIFQFLESQ